MLSFSSQFIYLRSIFILWKKKKSCKKKLERFYEDISKKRKPNQEIRLQTDQEFQQNKIKRLNASNNITMFSAETRTAAEQKIRELIKSS